MKKYHFQYKHDSLENVSKCKYLGLNLTTFGNFTEARKELRKTALKALYKLKKEMGKHFKTDLKLFDTLVLPIILQGSEIWGMDNNEKAENQDPGESIHMFCRDL